MQETFSQTVDSVLTVINARIDAADSYSRMIIYDSEVQTALRGVTADNYIDLYTNPQSTINNRIGQVLQISPFSAVYLYSMNGFCFSGYLSSSVRLESIDLHDMPWYEKVLDADGQLLVQLNAAGAPASRKAENYLSLIRCIIDINDFEPIGVVILNVPENDLKNELAKLLDTSHAFIVIRDAYGNCLTNIPAEAKGILSEMYEKDSGNHKITVDGQTFFCDTADYEPYGWSLSCYFPISERETFLSQFAKSYITILIAALVIMCIGTFLISRSITMPLKRLLLTMNRVSKGHLVKAEIPQREDEVYYLILGYNNMLDRIDDLIEQIRQQETDKRKYELEVLHSQIKPHFLYNTFDAISYLALSHNDKELYSLIHALGNYYRNSLSHGSEIISVKTEIEIVKDYLFILSYRYPNLFESKYDIDPLLLPFPILKLSLQPFVENAVYHGLKPMNRTGKIQIRVYPKKETVIIEIKDNGVGMPEEKIRNIMEQNMPASQESFGIRGTIERLRLYYNLSDLCQIESILNEGTTVTLSIPKGFPTTDKKQVIAPGQWQEEE